MKVIVVTGANSGIGRSTALHLAARGHTVWAGMRDLAKSDKLLELASSDGVDIQLVRLDVTDDASVQEAFTHVVALSGPVDVLVNNAGLGSNKTVEDTPISAAQVVMDTNLFGPWRCTQAVVTAMRERRSGHIIQVSSIAGRLAIPAQPSYCASKWALEAMSECLAAELAPFGVRVSIIEPGVTRTPMLAKDVDVPEDTAYGPAYARLFEMYGTGIAANIRPEVVAETIGAAIDDTAEPQRLRWPCAWGGAEITGGRARITDEDYVGLGALATDGPAWRARFADLFGLSLEGG